MPDISKCDAVIGRRPTQMCPLKDRCWRFLAPPHPWQSWYVDAPYDKSKGECDCFWERTHAKPKKAKVTT